MTLQDILKAQQEQDLGVSYFPSNEYNGFNENEGVVSVNTKQNGTFRFRANVSMSIDYIKKYVSEYIQKSISGDCGVVKFEGKYINIPNE